MKKLIPFLCSALLSIPAFAEDKINVVASIKPLQLLVHELLEEQGNVDVLLPKGASPHHYNLKPSDIRKLSSADLIVWVGEDLEQYLAKPLRQSKRPALAAYQPKADEHHDGHDDHHKEHDSHHDDHHDEHANHKAHDSHHEDDHHEEAHHDKDHHEDGHHQHGQEAHHGSDEHHHDHADDVHVWLDPAYMSAFAEQVIQQLIQTYPQKETALNAKLEAFQARLNSVDKGINTELTPYQAKGFVVFHDAFEAWIEHYQLTQLAYFTVDPGRAIGARKLADIRSLIDQKNAACVFIEPQFEAAVVKRVVDGTAATLGHIDPLASDNALQDGYTGYIKQLSHSMIECLK